MSGRVLRLALGVSLATAAWLLAPPAESSEEAGAKVDRFHNLLIKTMQVGEFGAREANLAPAVADFFAHDAIARISLGSSWRTLSAEQRAAFAQLLKRLIIATYADRFDSYSGQTFERLETVAATTGPVVKSRLTRANGKSVNLDYYFRGGKVFNVVADGVSDLSLRRADYSSIIRKQGYEALISHIEASIQEAADGGS